MGQGQVQGAVHLKLGESERMRGWGGPVLPGARASTGTGNRGGLWNSQTG